MLDFIKKILDEKKGVSAFFKRNLAKEYFQIMVLSFLYSRPDYQGIIFYGGSCLRHCFDLPRLSEDLDFVDIKKQVNLENLAKDIKKFFDKKLGIKIITTIQKFRIYLKFPILYDLGLIENKKNQSDFLILKIEVFKDFDFCKKYQIEIMPLFKFGNTTLVRTFDISTLMATKIGAILFRKWEKTDKKGKILTKVKGRDYYDLMWYLAKDIEPNLKCIKGISDKNKLREKLLEIVEKVSAKNIEFDLEALIEEKEMNKDLGKNIKKILINQLKKF